MVILTVILSAVCGFLLGMMVVNNYTSVFPIKKPVKVGGTEADEAADEQKLRLQAQLENMLRYNGTADGQVNIDE